MCTTVLIQLLTLQNVSYTLESLAQRFRLKDGLPYFIVNDAVVNFHRKRSEGRQIKQGEMTGLGLLAGGLVCFQGWVKHLFVKGFSSGDLSEGKNEVIS